MKKKQCRNGVPVRTGSTTPLVTTVKFKNNILEISELRDDKWEQDVNNRFWHVSDLVASDGRYQGSRFKTFMILVPGTVCEGREMKM
ncbi:hypothetical protein AVEN_101722-1 [Araneus ventricosus]|uniref:Uncharacterized protein n=1 Tax=Araneus ventricosus TaxID=182803 RepID=A0A4Y2X8Y1_ARAVE|nr:hypothetical protein AVEN_101722-1 [Araneus ventricosus]